MTLGATPPSFDKQPLPDDVISATTAHYVDAYERITGRSFADWPGASETQTRGFWGIPATPYRWATQFQFGRVLNSP